MKRGLVVAVMLLFSVAFVGAAFAQEATGDARQAFQNKLSLAKEVKFSGEVISHDPLCHCVVVKTAKGNMVTMQDDYAKFMQEYNQAKGLKIGAKVAGVYKTVDYIHYLISVGYAD
jgi:hypothetical protein